MILNLTDAYDRLAQWWLHLLEASFNIVHRAGVKNQATDATLRFRTEGTGKRALGDVASLVIHIDGIKHDECDGVIKYNSSTISYVKEAPTEIKATTYTKFIKANSKNVFCQLDAEQIGVERNIHIKRSNLLRFTLMDMPV